MPHLNDFSFLHHHFENKMGPILPEIYLVEENIGKGLSLKRHIEKHLNLKVKNFISPEEFFEFKKSDLDHRDDQDQPYLLVTIKHFKNSKFDGLMLVDCLKSKGHKLPYIILLEKNETISTKSKNKDIAFYTTPEVQDYKDFTEFILELFKTRLGLFESEFHHSYSIEEENHNKHNVNDYLKNNLTNQNFSYKTTLTHFNLPEDGIDLKKLLNDIEDRLIEQALEKANNNKNQASRLLRMNRTTLIEKLKKKGTIDCNYE